MIFSTLTFTTKLKIGVASFLVGLVLEYSGYIPNAVQTDQARGGITMMLTLIPAAGALITVIPLLFYRLDRSEHKRLVEELE